MPQIELNIVNLTSTKLSGKNIFKKIIQNVLVNFNIKKKIAIGLIFVKESFIKKLNSKYRKTNKATDVLTFGTIKDLSVDIVICPAVARLKAKIFSLNEKQMIYKLFIHGLLHFLGYNDKIKKDAILMDKIETKLMKKLYLI